MLKATVSFLTSLLSENKPSTVRNLLADQYMTPGEMETSIIPNLNKLQQVRHQTKHAYFLHPSPFFVVDGIYTTIRGIYSEILFTLLLCLLYYTDE